MTPERAPVTSGVVLAAAMLVREMLVTLERKELRLAKNDLFPSAHCYALSCGAAKLLTKLGYSARVAVGTALGSGFNVKTERVTHSWVVVEGQFFDPKQLVGTVVVFGMGPMYTQYEELSGDEAKKLVEGFENACGMADDVFDVIVERCLGYVPPAEPVATGLTGEGEYVGPHARGTP